MRAIGARRFARGVNAHAYNIRSGHGGDVSGGKAGIRRDDPAGYQEMYGAKYLAYSKRHAWRK